VKEADVKDRNGPGEPRNRARAFSENPPGGTGQVQANKENQKKESCQVKLEANRKVWDREKTSVSYRKMSKKNRVRPRGTSGRAGTGKKSASPDKGTARGG